MDVEDYRLRKALGTLGQQGDLVAAQAYRQEQATSAIARGQDRRQAWSEATRAASRAFGVTTADLWAASRLGQALRTQATPPPLVAPERRTTPLGACEDDPAAPDPRFPRKRGVR